MKSCSIGSTKTNFTSHKYLYENSQSSNRLIEKVKASSKDFSLKKNVPVKFKTDFERNEENEVKNPERSPKKYKTNKAESKKIWKELYKALDTSDAVIEVLDARNPYATRCMFLEKYVSEKYPHKNFILLLNKCDLVPSWVTKKWLITLSKQFPTVAFHSSTRKPFGRTTLLSVLHQLSNLRYNKPNLYVGLFGYPNVGKSSIINILKNKKLCKSTSVPGETKTWQFVIMMKRISLIDLPGIAFYENKDSVTELILKGAIRLENITDTTLYIPEVLRRINPYCLKKVYHLSSWTNSKDFLSKLAIRRRLFTKNNGSDNNSAAKIVLHDWQRGRFPFFELP